MRDEDVFAASCKLMVVVVVDVASHVVGVDRALVLDVGAASRSQGEVADAGQ